VYLSFPSLRASWGTLHTRFFRFNLTDLSPFHARSFPTSLFIHPSKLIFMGVDMSEAFPFCGCAQPKTCAKCGGQMKKDKRLQALNCDVILGAREFEIRALDEEVITFYCEKCGHIEIYRLERKSR